MLNRPYLSAFLMFAILRKHRWLFPALTVAGTLFVPSITQAALVEEVITAPVALRTMSGVYRQEVVVTVFRDDQRPKSPYLVLNHGRPVDEAERAAMGRVRFPRISPYLVSLGFTVLVPTRIGYGATSGPDLEGSGPCGGGDPAYGFDVAAAETAGVLQRARTLPYVDLSKGIVAGTSFGGMLALRLAAENLPGLAGAVNFSGGRGGNPIKHPENPCAPNMLNQLYRSYGAAAKVPTLWLYSSNDLFWGPRLPHQWFQSFVAAGGNANFVQLPPYGANGHSIFTGDPEVWKPAFEQFLRDIGFS